MRPSCTIVGQGDVKPHSVAPSRAQPICHSARRGRNDSRPRPYSARGVRVARVAGYAGAAVGAQIGVRLTDFFRGPKIRLAFSPLPLIGAALIVYGLLTGHQMK